MSRALLRVGRSALVVDPPLFLAPMAGVTHTAFRRLLSELGGVGLYSTEMLSARSLPAEDRWASPYLRRTPAESPLSHQVLLAAPEEVGPAFEVLHALGADAIDVNLGCPAPEVRRRGAGSALAALPEEAARVLREARRRTPLPLTAKIRLGERLDEGALRDLCLLLEAEGVDLVTVHARLRGEPYGRRPRWAWIGKVKSWVSVPVVGNGGIFTPEDARRCLEESGCDGLMLGRGAVIRPWLFARVARDVFGAGAEVPAVSRPALYRRFLALAAESFPPERRLGRIKEFTHYFSQTYPFGHSLATAVQGSRSLEEARERSEAFFAANERTGAGDVKCET
ncbi:MAG: tRNA-dihydrouridine synthase family protein [Deferrisomatales bacterium]|nr:tRNA-dihydrouridine synthase family protein [Deferrisomatales bacterium]